MIIIGGANMYSKYEEMRVMSQVMQSYANVQKRDYESYVAGFKEKVNGFSLDIDNKTDNPESFKSCLDTIELYRSDYQSALNVISELNKAVMCYEQGYTQENIQSGLADERAKEGNRIFYEIRTQNAEYKKILNEISYGLFVSHDPRLDGLGMDLDAKLEELDKDFAEGKLTKEQLIYYINVCSTLVKNPDYIQYMSEQQSYEKPIQY